MEFITLILGFIILFAAIMIIPAMVEKLFL